MTIKIAVSDQAVMAALNRLAESQSHLQTIGEDIMERIKQRFQSA